MGSYSTTPIRNLVKAGALIAAEIDRLQETRPDPAGASDDSGSAEQESGPMSDYDIGRGAFLQYVETGDECYIANMRPDEMRAVLQTLGDVRRAAVPLRSFGRCPGNTVTAEELAEFMQEEARRQSFGIGFTPAAWDSLRPELRAWVVSTAVAILHRFFPEHIAHPEPVAVRRCGRDFSGQGIPCARPLGHEEIEERPGVWLGCSSVWRPEDGPEPSAHA
jgi:hypothetical protein